MLRQCDVFVKIFETFFRILCVCNLHFFAQFKPFFISDIIRKKKGQSLIQFATPFEIDFNTHSRPEVKMFFFIRMVFTPLASRRKFISR